MEPRKYFFLLTLNTETTRPRVRPHTLAVLSSDPETANSPFEENATHVMEATCPSNVECNSWVLSCQMFTRLSTDPVTADQTHYHGAMVFSRIQIREFLTTREKHIFTYNNDDDDDDDDKPCFFCDDMKHQLRITPRCVKNKMLQWNTFRI